MSRTDVHRPWRVQAADPYNRHRLRRHQAWSTEPPILVPLYNTCGCPGCSARDWRRAERRRERYGARHEIRQQLNAQ